MSLVNDQEVEVGYSKPPVHTRFRMGQSGNPKGRPKGRLNIATVLEKTLREKVVINENGRRKTITKLEAAMKQLVNKAASGDLPALRQLSAMARSAEEQAGNDAKVLKGILSRFTEEKAEEGDADANAQ